MENAKSFLSSLISAGGASGRGAPAAAVSSIYVYPIKSCRGISLSQAPVSPTGFRWDRQWLVVNSKGRAYTQRVEPKLALVEIEMPNGAFDEGWEPTVDSYMVIKAPGMDPLKVPLVAEHAVADEVSVSERMMKESEQLIGSLVILENLAASCASGPLQKSDQLMSNMHKGTRSCLLMDILSWWRPRVL